MSLKIYRPELFQGDLKKKNYFEGWYFKHVSNDLNHILSIIPGISLTENDSHAFIQVINGLTGKSEYITYPLSDFKWNRKSLYLEIGDSVFTHNHIDLKINGEKFIISGRIEYSDIVRYPAKLFSPGIMGWYSFVPYMECKHGIVSVNHRLTGSVSVNDDIIDFSGGKGYIEKDWGTSFPEAWIWMQANNFNDPGISFSFSVAKIPWLGKFFIGFIALLYFNNQFYLFSTYNNSQLSDLKSSGGSIELILKNHKLTLNVRVVRKTFGELIAPASGNMSRRIKESIDSEITLRLFDKNNNLILTDQSKRAGLEVIDKIFDYLGSRGDQ